jgi:hypothetical protein
MHDGESNRLLANIGTNWRKFPQVPDAVREKLTAGLAPPDKRNDEQKNCGEHARGGSLDDKDLFARYPDLKSDLDKVKAATAAEASDPSA